MNWTKIDPYHWQSACLRYTVSRAMMFDKDPSGVWVYTAWKRATTADQAPLQLGKCVVELKTAVRRCRDDRLASEMAASEKAKQTHENPS